MEYRQLGSSGLKVSRLCLGTMMFGGVTDARSSARIIDSARDAGVNFIDTADVYNGGESEVATGAAIAGNRDEWVVATKIGNPMGPGANQSGLSRKWIVESVEGCLRRLGSDYIDILYFHRPFDDAGLAEALRAIGDLIRAGKLRYFGISNFQAWRLGMVCHLADALGIDRPIATQPVYSIVDRSVEREQMPAARHYGVGVVTYSPLARGVLTGKYVEGAAPEPGSRAERKDPRMMQTEWRTESLSVAQTLRSHAEARGVSMIEFALAWVLANRNVSAVIAGPRTHEQWQAYLTALDVRIDPEDEALVDRLVSPGHPSTPGFNDPAYPVEGRITG